MARVLEQFKDTPISFGGAAISGEGAGYGFGKVSEDEAYALINHSFDRGVRIFDAAPIYGFGLCEKRLGATLHSKREKVFLVSKCGVSWHSSKRVNMTNDPQTTINMLEQSLRDLKSEYIDLYMVHWPDEKVDIRKTMEVLAKAKEEGKIKHVGLCNSFNEDIQKASEIVNIDVLQCQLNYFETEVVDRLLIPFEKEEMSFMSWGTYDKGVLTGRVTKDSVFDKSDCRSWAPWWKADRKSREIKYEKVNSIRNTVEKDGYSLVDFALASNLYSHETVDTVICGMKSIKQIDETIESVMNLPSRELMNQWMKQLGHNEN